MKYQLLLFSLLILLPTLTFAQNSTNQDYYITNERDTVFGKITKVHDNYLKIKVNGKRTKLSPFDVFRVYQSKKRKLFGSSYIKYGVRKIKDSKPILYRVDERTRVLGYPKFTEILIDGEIIVYRFEINKRFSFGGLNGMSTSSSVSYRLYAFKKSTDEILELENTAMAFVIDVNKAKIGKDVIKFFENDVEINAKIEAQNKLTTKFMLEIIKLYNMKKRLNLIRKPS
ncbi:hypothetical protein ACFRAE_00210 [Sphingobacterium sp. HJSM2_6]|uniref:hypothetical protein n=1 Tax=Sphingobacterium sp. HJSM2_6 TaxID=3366264 RepID=UPI003BBF7D6C